MPSYPLPAAVHALFGATDPQRTAANLKAAQVVDECDMPALAAAQRQPVPAAVVALSRGVGRLSGTYVHLQQFAQYSRATAGASA